MLVLILGLVVFLGVHSIRIFAEGWRQEMLGRLGEGTWKGIFSIVALIGFVLIIVGYGMARQSPELLYQPPFWLRHVSMLLMLPVFPLLIAAYLNGHIRARLKHPMLIATKSWAVAHLLANGFVADILLFGGFLAWAVADMISVKKRGGQPVVPPKVSHDLVALVAGLGLYVLFAAKLHAWLIGVPVVAMSS